MTEDYPEGSGASPQHAPEHKQKVPPSAIGSAFALLRYSCYSQIVSICGA